MAYFCNYFNMKFYCWLFKYAERFSLIEHATMYITPQRSWLAMDFFFQLRLFKIWDLKAEDYPVTAVTYFLKMHFDKYIDKEMLQDCLCDNNLSSWNEVVVTNFRQRWENPHHIVGYKCSNMTNITQFYREK